MRLRIKRSNSFITIASHTNRIGPNSTSKSHTVWISNHSAFLAGGLLLPIAMSGVATPLDNALGNLSQLVVAKGLELGVDSEQVVEVAPVARALVDQGLLVSFVHVVLIVTGQQDVERALVVSPELFATRHVGQVSILFVPVPGQYG